MRFLVIASLLVLPMSAAADIFTFETPSGNIDCSVGVGEAPTDIICTIHQREGAPARPRPAGCSKGWGHVFKLRAEGQVTMACEDPGQNLKMFEIAEYGVSSGDWGGLSCTSRKAGLECRNADGHGFILSRRLQKVY